MTDATLRNSPEAGMIRLVTAAQESLTDSMVERLSTTGANALEVVDRLNDEETRDAVMTLIDKVTEMHKTGALDTLFQMLALVHGVRSALTDSMVERLCGFAENMVDNLANEDMAAMANNVKTAMDEAVEEAATAPQPSGGLFSTLSMLGKPETQKSLQFLLAFAGNIQKHSADR